MEEESSSESEDESREEMVPLAIDRKQFGSTAPPLPPLPPAPDKVIVKKGYDPKLGIQKYVLFQFGSTAPVLNVFVIFCINFSDNLSNSQTS